MDDLQDFWVHTATVETYVGTDGYGRETFAPASTFGCFIEQKRRLVRDKTGAEVISETTLYGEPTVAALCTPGTRVTINGTETRVITASLLTSGDLDLPDHTVVSLT